MKLQSLNQTTINTYKMMGLFRSCHSSQNSLKNAQTNTVFRNYEGYSIQRKI